MRLPLVCSAAAAALCCASAALADQSPGFATMTFMVGNWTCTGQAVDGSNFTIQETTTTDGSRFLTHDSENKTATELYFDLSKGAWIQTSIDKGSGSQSDQTSPGWNGNNLVFVGTLRIAGLQTVPYRSTTIKLSDAKTRNVDEIQKGDGSWATFDTAICEKGR